MKKTIDMTIGSPYKNVLLFCVPVFLGQIFQLFYNMADTIIVGRFLGEEALAAVGATGSLVYLIVGFANGLTQGFGITISQAFGAKDFKRLRHLVALSLSLTVIISVAFTIPAFLFCKPLLIMMNIPANILDFAVAYLQVIFLGIVLNMGYNVSANILRAVGDSKTPLYFLIISSFINIGLDIVFISVFHLGTAGAALATILAQGISALLCYTYMFRSFDMLKIKKDDIYFDTDTILVMLKTGIPMAMNNSITAIGMVVLQTGINQFGSSVVAAYTTAGKVEMISHMPMIAFGTAMSTYCGQNLGANRLDRIYLGIRRLIVVIIGIAVLGSIMYFTASRFLISCFISDPSEELYTYALRYLYVSGWFLIALALIHFFRASLIGLSQGLVPMLGGAIELACRFIFVQFLLQPLGYWCICLTNPSTWVVTSIFFAFFYFRWEIKTKKKNAAAL